MELQLYKEVFDQLGQGYISNPFLHGLYTTHDMLPRQMVHIMPQCYCNSVFSFIR